MCFVILIFYHRGKEDVRALLHSHLNIYLWAGCVITQALSTRERTTVTPLASQYLPGAQLPYNCVDLYLGKTGTHGSTF